MKGCTDRSSLAPKPPPTAVGNDAHFFGRDAENPGDVVAIHIGRLGAGLHFDAVADATGKTRFGLDVGVLDKTGLENPFDDDVGCPPAPASTSPRTTRPTASTLLGRRRVETRRIGAERLIDVVSAGSGVQMTGNVAEVERGHRFVLADDQRHRVAAKARTALRQRRLIGEGGNARRSG